MSISRGVLAAAFVVAGVLHFRFPGTYARIVPPWLPAPRALVLVSGAAEVLGGLGLLHPATREAAGWGLMLLLLAVWPANFHMLQQARAAGVPAWHEALLWARLPVQIALILWVRRAAGLGE